MKKMRALLGAGFIILAAFLSNPAAAQNQTVIPQVTVAGQLQRWTGMTLGAKNVGTVAIVDAIGNQIALFATSTKQSDGTQKTQIVDGSGNVIAATSNNLNVQCANCSGSGVSTADAASFTASASLFAGTGGFFQTTSTNNALTNGQQGMWQMTANRAGFVNLRNASGAELGVAAAPVQVSLANTAANATAVKVDGSAATQPVSGTVTANAGTGNHAITAASGSIASGAVSAGAYASGAVVAGAFVDGWDATQGAKVDTAWVSGSGSVIALLKNIAGGVSGAIPAGSAIIGKVGIDQTAPGTTNLVALAANQSVNVAQVNGVTPLMGNGATGTGSQRVTIASDNTPFQIKQTDGTTSVVTDPCQGSTKLYKPISITTATTTNVITGTSAKKTYICHIFLTSAAADNVAIIEGTTGATCGAGTAGLIGGTTAANGPNFSANGGMSLGNGGFSIAATATNNNDVCLITSAATPLAGSITYAQQ